MKGLDPDMLLLGKALGNGFHVGAALFKSVPDTFYRPSLIGGAGDTELTYAAGCAVFEELLEHGLLEHISDVSDYLEAKLKDLQNQCDKIRNICCKGLAASIEFYDQEFHEYIYKKMKETGLIAGSAENHKIIFRPPYAITKDDIDEVVLIMRKIIE